MGNSKRGRPATSGERYPCGKKKSKSGDGITPILWQRIVQDVVRQAADPRLATELGRLSFHGELSAAEVSAGFKLAEIYGRFERLHGRRRSAVSPSYEAGARGDPDVALERLEPEQRVERERRDREAEEAFRALQEEIPAFPVNCRTLLERVCVEDRPIDRGALDQVRGALDHLARYFGVVSARKAAGQPSMSAAPPSRRVRRRQSDRDAWMRTIGILRPDLSDAERLKAYDLTQALKDRQAFNDQATNLGGPRPRRST